MISSVIVSGCSRVLVDPYPNAPDANLGSYPTERVTHIERAPALGLHVFLRLDRSGKNYITAASDLEVTCTSEYTTRNLLVAG